MHAARPGADGRAVARPSSSTVLLDELGAYQPDLLERERVVVGSRADLAPDDTVVDDAGGPELDLRISAVTGAGIPQLRGRLAEAVRRARAAVPEPSQFVVHRPVTEGYTVVREGGGWVVEGREAVRAVNLSDLTRHDALDEAHRRLQAPRRRPGAGPGGRPAGRPGAHRGPRVRLRGRGRGSR